MAIHRRFLDCFAALAMTLLLILGSPAYAQTFPQLTGRVVDDAHLLTAEQVQDLTSKSAALEASKGAQLVVATVPSLQGYPIEDYGYRLGRAWGIGQKGKDNGVILLVAPSEHKVRIEVGYGLTPYITDILSGRIIRDSITPKFKQGDMAGGIEAGVNDILGQLSKSPEDAKAIAEAAAAAEKNAPHQGGGGFPVGGILWVLFIGFFFILPAFRRRNGRRYGGGVGSTVGNILLWSALSSMGGGRGRSDWGGGGGGGFGGGGGGGFGGFGGGMSGGGGASGGW